MSDGSIEIQTVGAIRLALEAAANDGTALAVIRWLIKCAPDTNPTDTASVDLFLAAVRSLDGSFAVPVEAQTT